MDSVCTRFLQYQNAIEQSNIVSKTNVNGIITFVNDEFCKISGYSREELIGKNHNIVRHPDVSPDVFKKMWQTILSKKVYKTVAKNLNKDGSIVYLNTTIIPILDEQGEILEFVAIRHDITKMVLINDELVRTQSKLRELNEQLEVKVEQKTAQLQALNKHLESLVLSEVAKNEESTKMLLAQSRFASMGEMVASIAHQWRQPLNELSILMYKLKQNIKGLADDVALWQPGRCYVNPNCRDRDRLLASPINPQKISQEFEMTYGAAKQVILNMSNTIDDFRSFFSSEQEMQGFWLSEIFSQLELMIGNTLATNMIKLIIEVKSDTYIKSYKSWLNQVMINVVKNAKDALEESDKEDKIIKICLFQKGEYAIISIKDNASGVPDELASKIFEPFFTTKKAKQGTGLGLYVSRLILERIGGKIELKSSKDGTCFSILLPLCKKHTGGGDDV
ncbi:PAS domain S-box protein [Campylobacter sp. 19-13652]|uniref:PAS domain-containing sensor histidine kinase n=1 Tax=Campylobacter sp. 19-13652 TaxID=2840180 RepID=UPI001C794AEB|nr:PAS domain S-box protein [Campylobacter sp. 19-13652]BCX80098.1 ATPase [Campylobacter sp. 19-13652]